MSDLLLVSLRSCCTRSAVRRGNRLSHRALSEKMVPMHITLAQLWVKYEFCTSRTSSRALIALYAHGHMSAEFAYRVEIQLSCEASL